MLIKAKNNIRKKNQQAEALTHIYMTLKIIIISQ